MSNEKIVWDFFKGKALTDFGVAGLMGNLYAESGLMPNNLQNTGNKKLGMTDNEYVNAVDTGKYTNFVNDKQGFGLAQWTFWTRKQALLNYAKASGTSIGNFHMQLGFLWEELAGSYSGVLSVLRNASSILEASNAVLFNFEQPADQGDSVQKKRASFGQVYYDKYASQAKGDGLSMGNSPLVTYTKISPNRTSPRNHEIDTVTIHCFVGQVTAKSGCNARGFVNYDPKNGASCQYVVGHDGSIGLCVEEKDRSWCSSSGSNDHRAITIEVASDTTDPYAVTDAAFEALIRLLVDICQRNPGIKRLRWCADKSLIGQVDKQNMTVHRWFANKACPGNHLYGRHGEIAAEVNRRLDAQENGTEDDDMDVARFTELWNEMRKELQDNDCSAYSAEARQWATGNGLIAGNGTTINGEPNCMWADVLTREQFVTVLYRFAQMMGRA